MSYRDVNNNRIGLARNPEPPDPGPSEEERIEYRYSQIRDSEWHIERCIEGDDRELAGRLARLLAEYRSCRPGTPPEAIRARGERVLEALNEWMDSELMYYAKVIVEERIKRGDYEF